MGTKSFPGNPFDGHTLKAAIEQASSLTGVSTKEAYVDRGYMGHGIMCRCYRNFVSASRSFAFAAVEQLQNDS